MTFPSSLNSGCVNALASLTASLIALIPVLIFFRLYGQMDNESSRSVQGNFGHGLNTDETRVQLQAGRNLSEFHPWLKAFSGFRDVASDLRFEFVERGKLFFGAKFRGES